jgi:hypothetical protein
VTTTATISAPTLLADKPYIFWVKARNAIGLSAFSPQIAIYSASLPGAPGDPFRNSGTNGNFIIVDWTVNPSSNFGGTALTAYEIWWN